MGRNTYTAAPSRPEATLEGLSKGWPKTLSLPIHKQHPLLKSLRPAFTCNGCRTAGKDWSFHCPACDFDLHPNCALEAQLAQTAEPWPRSLDRSPLHRDHPLVKTRLDDFWCDSCGEKGSWWCFYCERCDFSLHLHCAFGPKTARDAGAADRQQQPPPGKLTLDLVETARGSYWCSKCAEEGKGACFRCEDYGVDLHPGCAAAQGSQWPGSVFHELHERHLLAKSRSDVYYCDKCWKEGRGCSFSCEACNFMLHPRCATDEEVDGPESWVERMARERRKEEATQQLQGQRAQAMGGDAEVQRRRAEEEAMQRMQMDAAMRQMERMRVQAETRNRIMTQGALGALEAVDGIARMPYGYGYGYRYY